MNEQIADLEQPGDNNSLEKNSERPKKGRPPGSTKSKVKTEGASPQGFGIDKTPAKKKERKPKVKKQKAPELEIQKDFPIHSPPDFSFKKPDDFTFDQPQESSTFSEVDLKKAKERLPYSNFPLQGKSEYGREKLQDNDSEAFSNALLCPSDSILTLGEEILELDKMSEEVNEDEMTIALGESKKGFSDQGEGEQIEVERGEELGVGSEKSSVTWIDPSTTDPAEIERWKSLSVLSQQLRLLIKKAYPDHSNEAL